MDPPVKAHRAHRNRARALSAAAPGSPTKGSPDTVEHSAAHARRTSVSVTLHRLFAGLGTRTEGIESGGSDALCALTRAFTVQYQRYIDTADLLAQIRHELCSGAEPLGAARYLHYWVTKRYASDVAGRARPRRHLCRTVLRCDGVRRPPAGRLPAADAAALRETIARLKLVIIREEARARAATAPERPTVSSPRSLVPPPPLALPHRPHAIGTLVGMDASYVARHLLHVDYRHFSRISVGEFYNGASVGAQKDRCAPALAAYVERGNRMSEWVATCVLLQDTVPKQAKLVRRFIEVASFCLQSGDHFACMAIMLGFNLWATNRLKGLWKDSLDRSHRLAAHRTADLNDITENYRNYRRLAEECMAKRTPCVPFLAPYQKAITIISESNPDYDALNQVNVAKLQLLDEQFRAIELMQGLEPSGHAKFDADKHQALTAYLEELPARSTAWLEDQSRRMRPAAGAAAAGDETADTWGSSSRSEAASHQSDESSSARSGEAPDARTTDFVEIWMVAAAP